MRKTALFLCLSTLSLTAGFDKWSPRSNEADRLRSGLEQCRQRGVSLAKALDYSGAREILADCHRRSVDADEPRLAAQVLANLGNLKFATHQYRGAMEDYLSARETAEAAGDRRLAGYLALNMSSLYFQLWSLAEARREWEEAGRILPDADREALRVPLLLQKARLDAWNGDLPLAVETFRDAIDAASQKADVHAQAHAWDLLGTELMDSRRLDDAGDAFTEAFRLRRSHDRGALYLSYLKFAILRTEQGRASEGLRWADRAIDAARGATLRVPLYLLSFARGRALARGGDLPRAHEELGRTLSYVRDFRLAELPADRVRAHTGGGLDAVYSEFIGVAAELYFRTGRKEFAVEALEAAESNRAAALRWSLSMASRLSDSVPPESAEALARLEAAHTRLFADDNAEARRDVAQARHRLLELELKTAGRGSGPRRFSLPELQRGLRNSEALIAFHLRETRSVAWVVTSQSVDLYPIADARAIRRASVRFTKAVRQSTVQVGGSGRELFHQLFRSHAASAKQRWLLVPDDVLFSTPFAALNVAEAGQPVRYLIEDHALTILPSAAMALRDAAPPTNGGMLALGDPIYNTADPRWRDPRPWWRRAFGIPPNAVLPRLPGTADEVERCTREWGPSRRITGDEARWDRLLAELDRRPSVVHLAAHLTPSPQDPRRMLLALGLGGEGEPELLGAETIRALRIGSPLVVLSGCSSAEGETMPGEGLRGLTTAWLEAGARTVAASLWPTPDHSGELLEAFYERLRQHPPERWQGEIDLAMQSAQVRMVKSDRWKSLPGYWGAHSLYGRSP